MSYDPEDQSELNTARRALGDITADELLTDDAIEAVILANGYNLGVAILTEGLAVHLAQDPSSVSLPSGLSVAWSERVAELRRVAARYRAFAAQEIAAAVPALTARAATVAVW